MTARPERLPGGLTLLLESDPHAQSVAAGFFVATGARDEAPEEMGASHFLEHLMFKGSQRWSAAELNARLDALGGHANAFTGEEATVYHAAALPEQAGELLATLSELLRPALRPADLEAERGVILEEIAMYAEQPGTRVAEELRAAYWGGHPLGHRILGTPQTVGALSREVLERHWRAHYGADRVTLVVTGAFDEEEVRRWARQELGEWSTPSWAAPGRAPAGPSPWPAPPLHPQTGSVQIIEDPALGRLHAAFALPGLPTAHPLRDAASILGELIGDENGALYWAIVDPGNADSADFAHLDFRDAGVFEGGFSCDPDRATRVLADVRQVLRSAEALITPQAVRRVARKAAVGGLLRAETPQGRLFGLGLDHLATGEVRSAQEQAERLLRVSAQEVQAALKACPLDRWTAVLLGPPGVQAALSSAGGPA
ncbi:Predicted Zn-dependent peptidase [Deinococcus reticulitermitis]|uniref:Predicted Zn-dependent peptidase n=1 Tax=Deinococcus reticulitermitis TaxID=856736 RepID=A0A1H6Z0K6_9DEIO|nr:pitrilysin family protein [Deinococcus reticulitermitis]SEJ44907.1 Predicted Zn-dependent peptidase [Deinococcus reticulitermitis]